MVSMTLWERVARGINGEDYATAYADRIRAATTTAAAAGEDPHGEATAVERLVSPPARVLDAGCGTGRIAIRLADREYEVTGVDVDASMLDIARHEAPALDWREADLSSFDLGSTYDLVLLAGNILPLLEPGTLGATCARLAAHLARNGLLVCGFGLDAEHLPQGCPVLPLDEVDAAMAAAGLQPVERWSTWSGATFDETSGYVVTQHARG